MGLLEELDSVMQEIREAKPVPLSASAMINKKSVLAKLEAIRRNTPDELKQARYVTQERDGMMSGAQHEIDQLRQQVYAERDQLLSRSDMVLAAKREAERILDEAHARADQMRVEAEDYVDNKLASFEVVLQKTMSAVTRGRESLRGTLDVAGQQVPTDLPGELKDPTNPRLQLRDPTNPRLSSVRNTNPSIRRTNPGVDVRSGGRV
ncbi:MAG: hypothetical protein ACT4OM_05340 [Actinomycetota bacterium]